MAGNVSKLFHHIRLIARDRRHHTRPDGGRRCCFEPMEPRLLLASNPLFVGAVYVEEDIGSDIHGDTFELTFEGGAPDTELTRVEINGDQGAVGFGLGDVFFDVEATGRGADHAFRFTVVAVEASDPTAAVRATVVDGDTRLVLDLNAFHAGDKLRFTIDVDEVEDFDPNETDPATINDGFDPITSGVEFQGSLFTASFSAPHYYDATANAEFRNRYDDNFQGSGLDLPADDDGGKRDRSAGAIGRLEQEPLPVAISGTVYLERNLDLHQDADETGIRNVDLALWQLVGSDYLPTGHTTATDAAGDYRFGFDLDLKPGVYQIRETQPDGLFSVGAVPGTVQGQPAGQTVAGDPDVLTEIALPLGGLEAIDLDFAEAQPAAIGGHVYHDRDNDGRREVGEEGIADVPVQIVPLQTIAPQGPVSVATDADGFYEATELAPGTYRVVEPVQPAGYLDGLDAAGTVDGVVHGAAVNPGDRIEDIFLGGGQTGIDYDFGELVPASIQGQVRLTDPAGNCDGPDVQPIGDVEVRLLDAAGTPLAQTTTDADGRYRFDGLEPGTYSVIEVTPDGLIDGDEHVGTIHRTPVGAIAANDTIAQIVLASGEQGIDYDFCEHLPASVAGYVYHDRDNDGWKETGEEGIGGVEVALMDAAGRPIATARTNANGHYQFDGLRAGVYAIVESHPDGWVDGLDRAGTIDGRNVGQAVNPGDRIQEVDLLWGDHGLDYNFGELRYAVIQGTVRLTSPDGSCFGPGSDSRPLPGVTVILEDEQGATIAQTTTNAEGRYRFDGLLPGTYTVVEVTPDGLIDGDDHVGTVEGRSTGRLDGNDRIVAIALASGQAGVDYDFCEHEPSLLSGYVYHDLNNNGRFDGNETPIADAQIALRDATGSEVASTHTDGQGFYQFAGLWAGTYTLAETQPAGYEDGTDAAGTIGGVVVGRAVNPGDEIRDVRLRWGESGVHYDFGELLLGSIRGRVYLDMDADCRIDADEPMLAGVTIRLLDASGRVVATTRTDSAGSYHFDRLLPGVYAVEQQQPPQYFTAGQQAGSGGGDDRVDNLISVITIPPGEDLVEYNFCEAPAGLLSGYVYQDGEPITTLDGRLPADLRTLRDGRRTPDDTPLPGVVLELRDGISGDPITGDRALPGTYGDGPIRTVTDADGYYEFRGLPRGNYAVFEIHPQGYVDGIDTPGTTSGLAINPSDEVDPLMIRRLAKDPANDAIILIPLAAGNASEENNFSEVAVRQIIIPPPDEPPVVPPPAPPRLLLPPPEPPLEVIVPPPAPPATLAIFGSGGMVDFTWHLSVVDAGRPRGRADATSLDLVWRSAGFAETVAWESLRLDDGQWTMRTGDPMRGRDPDATTERRFGKLGALPVAGDFNGDGVDEIGVFYQGYWYLDLNGNGVWDEEDLWARLGSQTDRPVTGDWNGDGKDDIGIFGPAWVGDPRALKAEHGLPDLRNPIVPVVKPKNVPPTVKEATDGLRLLKRTADGPVRADVIDHVFRYGKGDHIPVAGDWTGDGIKNIGVFHQGTWRLDADGDGRWDEGDYIVQFGQQGDLPVVGDFDGDGADEIGVFRGGRWIIDINGNRKRDAHDRVFQLGGVGDLPVAGDWDGDGVDDPAVYHEAAPEPHVAAKPE